MNDRAFGFIKPDDGSADVFVHVSALQRAGIATLDRNQRVTFDVEADRKQPGRSRAVNLRLAP
jgi:cold shock protein